MNTSQAQRLKLHIIRRGADDADSMMAEVTANFFDDKLDIIDDIVKFKDTPEMLGKIMLDRLNQVIDEAIAEEAARGPDEDELNRRLFDRNEARGMNS